MFFLDHTSKSIQTFPHNNIFRFFALLPASTSSLAWRRKYSTSIPPSTVLLKPRLNYRDISENAVYKSHNAFNRKAPLPLGAIQKVVKGWDETRRISAILNAKRNQRSSLGDKIRQSMSAKGVSGEC